MNNPKQISKIILGALIIAALGVGVTLTNASLNQDDIILTGFTHSTSENLPGATIQIEQSPLSLTFSDLITTDNDLFSQDNKNSLGTSYSTNTFRGANNISWAYPPELEKPATSQRYYMVLKPYACKLIPQSLYSAFAKSCLSPKYIELIRQTPAYLASIGIDKPDGYTIAGRTNLALPMKVDIQSQAGIQFKPTEIKPYLSIPKEVYDRLKTNNPTVLEAVRLTNVFYSKPIRVGTAGISQAQFNALPIDSRLDLIWSGKSAFQCAGLRDMWLEMAASSNIIPKVRRVGAYNYYPPFQDLVPYSHALAEFWVPEWNKWVGIDPWYGMMFRLDGILLDTTELTELSAEDKERVEMLPIVPKIKQYTQSLDGKKSYSSLSVKQNAPALSSKWANGSYSMGYMDYFNTVDLGASMSASKATETTDEPKVN